jgi:hypothetical protein
VESGDRQANDSDEIMLFHHLRLPCDDKCHWGPHTFAATRKGREFSIIGHLTAVCGMSDVMGVLKSAISIHSDSERVEGDKTAPHAKSPLSHTSLSVVRTSEAAASECRRISQRKGFTCSIDCP